MNRMNQLARVHRSRLPSLLARPRHICAAAHATSHRNAAPKAAAAAAPDPQSSPRSVYIHLPFCARKCWYCDFPVEAVGRNHRGPVALNKYAQYVALVRREIEASAVLGAAPIDTIFFGGGTPSLVPPDLLALIIDDIRAKFGLSASPEISMEADPGTFDAARLAAYAALGINRISMGVQAFQQELLESCGRAHSLADVYRAIETVHASGIPSWSLDLISGLPSLERSQWHHSLTEAIKACPTHISVYDLQVEEGTPFQRWYDQGRLRFPEDDDAAGMYMMASELLRGAGYNHYEISNYAKPGYECRHNRAYWLGHSYYAFGMGAASYLRGRRFTRPAKMKEYVAWVEALPQRGGEGAHAAGGFVPAMDLPEESKEDALLDTIMLRLRMAQGLDLDELAARYGADVPAVVMAALKPHLASGHALLLGPTAPSNGLEISAPSGHAGGDGKAGVVRLKDPEGFLRSNDIISDVFATFQP